MDYLYIIFVLKITFFKIIFESMEEKVTNTEMRTIFLYEWKLKHNSAEAARNIKFAFGKASANKRTIQRWFKKFENGDKTRVNEPRGRPGLVINNDKLRCQVELNTSQSVRELAKTFNVSGQTISRHLKEIGKKKKMDQWVPHFLNKSQKFQRLDICRKLLERNETDPFLHCIITCDEKWVIHHNRRRSAQWLDADEAPLHCPKPDLHPKKTMITVWWSMAGVIHYSFLKQGETITSDKYCSEIEIMYKKLCIKQPSLVNRKRIILLHDNARPHVAKKTLQKLIDLNIETLRHPPYSPDLSPTDYHFFKHLNHFLDKKIFSVPEDVEIAISEFIGSRNSDFYVNGILNIVSRWQKCVDVNGDYFI